MAFGWSQPKVSGQYQSLLDLITSVRRTESVATDSLHTTIVSSAALLADGLRNAFVPSENSTFLPEASQDLWLVLYVQIRSRGKRLAWRSLLFAFS